MSSIAAALPPSPPQYCPGHNCLNKLTATDLVRDGVCSTCRSKLKEKAKQKAVCISPLFYVIIVLIIFQLAPFKWELKDLDFQKDLDDLQAHTSEVVKKRRKDVLRSIANNHEIQVENNEYTHRQQIQLDSLQPIYLRRLTYKPYIRFSPY